MWERIVSLALHIFVNWSHNPRENIWTDVFPWKHSRKWKHTWHTDLLLPSTHSRSEITNVPCDVAIVASCISPLSEAEDKVNISHHDLGIGLATAADCVSSIWYHFDSLTLLCLLCFRAHVLRHSVQPADIDQLSHMSRFSGLFTFYSLPVKLYLCVFQTDYKLNFNEFSINLCNEAGQCYCFYKKYAKM